MTKTEIYNEMKNMVNNSKVIVENLVNDYIGKPYKVTHFNNDCLSIGFVTGKWNSGMDKTTDLEFYLGSKSFFNKCNSIDDYRFEINPFTGGSFDPTDNSSYLQIYFTLVGKVINNVEFCNKVKEVMYNLYKEYSILNDKIWEIEKEEKRINDEENRKIKEAEEAKDYEEKKTAIANNSEADTYVVIKKGDGGKFIYRKANVKVITNPISYNNALTELRNINKGYIPTGIKYAVVETSKIKFAA